jgi:hypothetical protein
LGFLGRLCILCTCIVAPSPFLAVRGSLGGWASRVVPGWPARFDALGPFILTFRLSGVPSEGGSAALFLAGSHAFRRVGFLFYFNVPAFRGSLGRWVSHVVPGWLARFDALGPSFILTFRLSGVPSEGGSAMLFLAGWPTRFDALGPSFILTFRLSGVPSEGGSAMLFQAGSRVSTRWVLILSQCSGFPGFPWKVGQLRCSWLARAFRRVGSLFYFNVPAFWGSLGRWVSLIFPGWPTHLRDFFPQRISHLAQ